MKPASSIAARIEQMRRELRELNDGLEIDSERVIVLIPQNSPSEKPIEYAVERERLLTAAHRRWPGPEPVRFVVFYGGAVTKGLPQFIDSRGPQKFDAPARIEPINDPFKPSTQLWK